MVIRLRMYHHVFLRKQFTIISYLYLFFNNKVFRLSNLFFLFYIDCPVILIAPATAQNERGPAGARHPHRRGDLQLQVVQPTKVLQRYSGRHCQNFQVELFYFRAELKIHRQWTLMLVVICSYSKIRIFASYG